VSFHHDEQTEKADMTETVASNNKAYSAPIVSKALKVLRMIAASPKNPGISEIASKLSLAKSTTHGILAALEESGWVLRDPITRRYTCGYAVANLARSADIRIPLVVKARPHLERLARELDEVVFLGICTGYQLLILDQVESSGELKITARPGTRLSVFAGSAGKVFLAHTDKELLENLIYSGPLPQFTANSVTDPDQYLADLERIRDAGVATDIGEYIFNLWCVSVPIFYGKKARRRMVAAFWVVGLNSEQAPQRMQTALRLGRATGEALSRSMSHYGMDENSPNI
jgi:DNA-binding IclR family transcriptional regulator